MQIQNRSIQFFSLPTACAFFVKGNYIFYIIINFILYYFITRNKNTYTYGVFHGKSDGFRTLFFRFT